MRQPLAFRGGVIIEPLAIELNEIIRTNAPSLYGTLSALGRELYFPRGILTQTAEAKKSAYRYNATIGMATTEGRPLHLRSLREHFQSLEPEETFPYAPTTGLPELRQIWRDHQLKLNPGLGDKSFSTPVVTSGLTHGLSIFADIFCDAGDLLLLPDMMWGNYRMIFATRRGADIIHYPFFGPDGGLDTRAFRDILLANVKRGKILVVLNFPNNPTGYSPYPEEANALLAALIEAAEAGADIVACSDDAYTGLFYDDNLFKESLFSLVADAHPRLTAVKVDGPTKEDYVWGFRVGFITFSLGENRDREAVYDALEKKVGGLIRGTISMSPTPSQSLLIHAARSQNYEKEKEEMYQVLKERYEEVRRVLDLPVYADAFVPYPFNSGYFMCLRLLQTSAERLRRHLLKAYGIGTIAIGERDLRVAFSCLEREHIKDLFDILYTATREIDHLEN
jgi:aspartate/methionine/tyrosine aminotransferase